MARTAQRFVAARTLDGVFAALRLPEVPESAERIAAFLIRADDLIEAFNRDYELGVIQYRASQATRGRYSVVPDFGSSLGMQDAKENLLAQLRALQARVFGEIRGIPGRMVGEPTPADVYFEFAVSQINFKFKIDPVYTEEFISEQRKMYEDLVDIADSEPTSVREFTQGVCVRALH